MNISLRREAVHRLSIPNTVFTQIFPGRVLYFRREIEPFPGMWPNLIMGFRYETMRKWYSPSLEEWP
jgi:hypothetical protein